jgi:phage/plasmid-associated DNA primase
VWVIEEGNYHDLMRATYEDLKIGRANQVNEIDTSLRAMKGRGDLDFLFDAGVMRNQHTVAQIQGFLDVYMRQLDDLIELPGSVEIIVSQKAKPNKKGDAGFVSAGLHWALPDVRAPSQIWLEARRRTLEASADDAFLELPLVEKDWEKVFDKGIYTSGNWMVYGHAKPGNAPYRAWRILRWNSGTKTWDGPPATVNADEWETVENITRMCARGSLGDQITPAVLKEAGQEIMARAEAQAMRRPVPGSRAEDFFLASHPTEDLETLKQHVMNVPNDETTDYDAWYRMGQALFNVAMVLPTEPIMLSCFKIWYDWSVQNVGKHSDKDIERQWNVLKTRPEGPQLTAGSIRFWSQTADPERYRDIQASSVSGLVSACIGAPDADGLVANLMGALYKDRFKCSGDTDKWYEFTPRGWKQARGARMHSLLKLLYTDTYSYFARREKELDRRVVSLNADPESAEFKRAEAALKNCRKIMRNCNKNGFASGVLSQLSTRFVDADFTDSLDENVGLLGVRNGVFDFDQLRVRAVLPEDRITKSTGHWVDLEVPVCREEGYADMMQALRTIYQSDENMEYMLNRESFGLHGHNDESIFIHNGTGSNAKTWLDRLIRTALGEYAITMDAAVVTQVRAHSSAARPDLLDLQGARRVSMEEPEARVVNTNALKAMMGLIKARGLFEKTMRSFQNQAKLHILCNQRPKFDVADGGWLRRLNVLLYPMKFVPRREGYVLGKFEAWRDPTMEDKLKLWAPLYLRLLLERYIANDRWLLRPEPPRAVLKYTEDYRIENDGAALFMQDCVVPMPGNRLRHKELRSQFTEWQRANVDFRGVKFSAVEDLMRKQHGPYPKAGWADLKIQAEGEEDVEEDADDV